MSTMFSLSRFLYIVLFLLMGQCLQVFSILSLANAFTAATVGGAPSERCRHVLRCRIGNGARNARPAVPDVAHDCRGICSSKSKTTSARQADQAGEAQAAVCVFMFVSICAPCVYVCRWLPAVLVRFIARLPPSSTNDFIIRVRFGHSNVLYYFVAVHISIPHDLRNKYSLVTRRLV